MTTADDLTLALELADAADAISLPRFPAHDFTVESKPDLSPVTEVDRAVEQHVSDVLATRRPDDALLGEEYGSRGDDTGRRWIIDPIDGTKNFVRGVPVWADAHRPLRRHRTDPGRGERAGPGHALVGPDRRWSAPHDRRAARRSRSRSRRSRDLADASVSYSSLSGWKERGLRDGFLDFLDDVWRTRAYGDFWSYMMVAEGVVDIAAEPELELYDMAALVPIVLEAGGRFTGLDGVPGPFGADAVASNGALHDSAIDRIGVRS